MKTYYKDPDATLDYLWDWGQKYLASGETIVSAVVTAFLLDAYGRELEIDEGFELNPDEHETSHTNTSVTAWISGGTLHRDYLLRCHVTTSNGRVDDWSIAVHIQQQ